ncbi:MAG: aconitate hydratase [Chloroflexota bacterium]|nr:aconitate hydratase [Dehalococcoidia bacterium]MEC8909382.1 aconitate hydratase [Chloroflexota bacterium]|tara:strand:+ start:1499 stop:3769 length:2271 start_codon:yes stop_codon:yes gene_type:complete
MNVDSTPQFVEEAYKKMERNLEVVRSRYNRPLTLAEKLLLGHLDDAIGAELDPGESYINLNPDRVAHQDVTGQMAILQFMQSGRNEVAVPTTVHCDHLIQARVGASSDLQDALNESSEVYQFLESSCRKYGMGFWKPGSGIIHQVNLENYAFPGCLVIGTDSHTPNAGGLGSLAIGVGGADAADVMAGLPWEVKYPTLIGVHLTGEMSGWTAPKDVIIYLAGVLTVAGGTNAIIEYFGPGVESISCTGKATITNMGAELGATGDVFPFDSRMATYLQATRRPELAELAEKYKHLLTADPEVEKDPSQYYDRIVEIDLSKLEPHITGPHSPDRARPISALAKEAKEEGFPDAVSAALVGSCTNSSYEDMSRCADLARQAKEHGLNSAAKFMITPGSEQVRATIARDGQQQALEDIGGMVLANACGPCIGQWRRDEMPEGEPNSIVTSYNRNFPKRNDANSGTMNFIASPELAVAMGLGGSLSFNPLTDTLTGADGKEFMLQAPKPAPEVPANGFDSGQATYIAPPEDGSDVNVNVNPDSSRLQILDPWPAWDGQDFTDMPVLVKASGKCTTDHISPAGAWLRFRGHLDNLSDNMFLGAVNAFTDDPGTGLNQLSGEQIQPIPEIAREYKAQGMQWIAIGDTNYGEGSSREHAAMSPRMLGAAAVITRSFARIHEANLKKQGVLPLTFEDPGDYDRIRADDRLSIIGLNNLTPGQPLVCVVSHDDGEEERINLRHTMNPGQIDWFKAGSAMNHMKNTA